MESIYNLTIFHPLFSTWKQDLVASDFFTDCRFFRVLPGFVAQFGINVRTDSEAQGSTYCVGSHASAPEWCYSHQWILLALSLLLHTYRHPPTHTQGDPFTELEWKNKPLVDDPVVASNVKGTITFATAGNNTRTSQLFIQLGWQRRFGSPGVCSHWRSCEVSRNSWCRHDVDLSQYRLDGGCVWMRVNTCVWAKVCVPFGLFRKTIL